MATVKERAGLLATWTARGWRTAQPWLGRALWLLSGLLWTGLWLLARLAAASKRAVYGALLLAALALWGAWAVSRDGYEVGFWAVQIGAFAHLVWLVPAWERYLARLEFRLASEPAAGGRHVDSDLLARFRARPVWVWVILKLAGLLLLIRIWWGLAADTQVLLTSLVTGFAAWWLAVWAALLLWTERRRRARWYLRGPRLPDLAAAEARCLTRWPRLAPVAAWRQRLAAPFADLGWPRALLCPWGECSD
ncbi:MAG: hypothetical protein IT204_02855 [Fimbriimonadaceae bacterium]|nr:hypothetical protein [Fimbriimonadaceae bacterium]